MSIDHQPLTVLLSLSLSLCIFDLIIIIPQSIQETTTTVRHWTNASAFDVQKFHFNQLKFPIRDSFFLSSQYTDRFTNDLSHSAQSGGLYSFFPNQFSTEISTEYRVLNVPLGAAAAPHTKRYYNSTKLINRRRRHDRQQPESIKYPRLENTFHWCASNETNDNPCHLHLPTTTTTANEWLTID